MLILFSAVQAQPVSAQNTGGEVQICIFPGTAQLTQAETQALKAALRSAKNEVDFKGSECFSAIDLRDEGDWKFVTLAGLANKPHTADWTVGRDAAWSDNAIIRYTDSGVLASVAGTTAFSRMLAAVPESIVPVESKKIIDPLSAYKPEPMAGETFLFPFEAGYQVYYGTKGGGVHVGEFTTVLGGSSMAVDLMSDGNTSSGHAPNRLLAVAPGTVVKKCSDASKNSTYLIIDNGSSKFLYAHVRSSTAPPLWAVITAWGIQIGELVPGTFSDGFCGYASQTASFFHVHLEFLNRPSLTLSDWTLDTTAETWQRGAEVWHSGEWKQVGNVVTGCGQVSFTGVVLYENANCNVDLAGVSKSFSAVTAWTDLTADPILNKASSIFVKSGWSAKVFDKTIAEGGGAWKCVAADMPDLSTSYYTNGDTTLKMNDSISSIQVFADGNCGSGGTSSWNVTYYSGHDHWLDPSNVNNQICQETISSVGLDKNYGASSPCNTSIVDDWVAEYNATVTFAAGNYVFQAQNDDGLKVWVNGVSIADRNASKTLSYICPSRSLSGAVPVRAMLNEETGDANVKLTWTTDVNVCNAPAAFGKVAPLNAATGQSINPTISWGKSTDAAGYAYCIDMSNNNTCDTGWQDAGNVTSQSLLGLAVGKTYYWHVRAYSAGGETYADTNTWWSFTTQPANLLLNPGFETGTTDPANWSKDAYTLPNSTFEWSSDFFHSGSRSVRVLNTIANDARWTQTVTVLPNTDYRLSGWIMTNDVAHSTDVKDAGANLSILDGTTNFSTPTLFGDNDWTFVSLNFNSGTSTQVIVAARVGTYSGATTGSAWFDDLTLEPAVTTPTFGDVPLDHPLYAYIQALWENGYTAGCSTDPLLFCPDVILDRAQSAVFMLRGQLGSTYAPPPAPWTTFTDDWTGFEWAQPWAEGMWQEGLTAGCQPSPLMYCPATQLPRVEASVFGLRMKYGVAYIPPAATGTLFADMTDTSYWGISWAEQAYLDGILPSCGTDPATGKPLFCPSDLVDRAWGAYLIVQAKNLLPTP